MRPHRLAPLLLTAFAAVVTSACTSAGSSVAPSAAPTQSAESAAPSTSASPSASMSPSSAPSDMPSADPSGSVGTRVDVVGTEYAYTGLEASYDGPISMAFRNEGAEVHEIVVVRKAEGVTQSWQELLALPEGEVQALVENIGVAFAEPGQTAANLVTATDPGSYLGICFIPQGTTELPSLDPNASEPPSLGTGAPHFTLGMLTEFTITE
jgi:hypothetical protein